MKAYVLQVLVVDHDELEADRVAEVLMATKYRNHCIAPTVLNTVELDIGEWDDDHPLNQYDTRQAYLDLKLKEK